jgi:hypothetical protein
LSGKLAAEVICDKVAGRVSKGVKCVPDSVLAGKEESMPVGVRGNYPIAFGGGQQGSGGSVAHP